MYSCLWNQYIAKIANVIFPHVEMTYLGGIKITLTAAGEAVIYIWINAVNPSWPIDSFDI